MSFNIDLAKKAVFIVANALTAIYTSLQIGTLLEKRAEMKEQKKQKMAGGV